MGLTLTFVFDVYFQVSVTIVIELLYFTYFKFVVTFAIELCI